MGYIGRMSALSCLLALAPLVPQGPDGSTPQAEPLTSRIAVLGASLSAGTGNSVELVTPKDVALGRFLACVLPPEGVALQDLGDMWFFMDPVAKGPKQVDAALATSPTLVVALDFLFWYGYGDGFRSDDDRLARLELGLAQLDRFACPIVIGDFPDVSIALQGKGPLGQPLVTPSMIPREVALNRLNTRLAYWLAERPRVAQVPLGPMLKRMQAGQELSMRGNAWKPAAIGEVLQADLLHPTARGTVWVALATTDVILRAHPSLDAATFQLDEVKVTERLMAATADERAKEQKKRADREERRRRAEERRKKADAPADGVPAGSGGGSR